MAGGDITTSIRPIASQPIHPNVRKIGREVNIEGIVRMRRLVTDEAVAAEGTGWRKMIVK